MRTSVWAGMVALAWLAACGAAEGAETPLGIGDSGGAGGEGGSVASAPGSGGDGGHDAPGSGGSGANLTGGNPGGGHGGDGGTPGAAGEPHGGAAGAGGESQDGGEGGANESAGGAGGDGQPGGGAAGDGGNGGDAPLLPLTRSAWVVTASHSGAGSPPGDAIDGAQGSRWASGATQTPGMYFQVDMGSAQTFRVVELDYSSNGGGDPWVDDFPTRLRAMTSDTGLDGSWTIVEADLAGGKPFTRFEFETAIGARFIRLELTEGGERWWSIPELLVYQ